MPQITPVLLELWMTVVEKVEMSPDKYSARGQISAWSKKLRKLGYTIERVDKRAHIVGLPKGKHFPKALLYTQENKTLVMGFESGYSLQEEEENRQEEEQAEKSLLLSEPATIKKILTTLERIEGRLKRPWWKRLFGL